MAEKSSKRSRRKQADAVLIPEVLGKIKLRLRSARRGRERWEAECIRRRPRLAQQVQFALAAAPGVLQAEANPITGRILVVYDPSTFAGTVETLVQRVLDGSFLGDLPQE